MAYNPPDLSLRLPLFLTLVSLTIHNSNFDNRLNSHLLSTSIVKIRIFEPSIHPSILLMVASTNLTCVLLFSLANNARNTLPDWCNDVCSQARDLCAPHERIGALTLVATDVTLNAYPGHIINLVDVLANGDAPVYLACPTWDLPVAQAANVTAAVVSLYREELTRNHAFVAATSVLA